MILLDFPNAISNVERFYGRWRELELIQSTLASNPRVPVVVIGERRVGKTSIHNVAIQRLKERTGDAFIPLVIEPRGILSVDQFIEAVLSRLSTWAKSDLRNSGLLAADGHVHLETPHQLDEAFFRLVSPVEHRYLLCIDEFDELVRIASEAGDGERMKLMGIIHHLVEKTEIPLSLFLTMTRLPEGASREIASPLLAKCEVIELRPFSFPDMADMVLGLAQGKAIISRPELQWLYDMSGGHPYITKLLLANLFQRVMIGDDDATVKIMPGMLDQSLRDAVDDPRAHYAFENIYRVHWNADEKRIMLYLAERDEPVDIGELRIAGASLLTVTRNLEKRFYLVEQDGVYQYNGQFLGCWLRNWAEFDEEIERLRVHRMVNDWSDGNELARADASEDNEHSR